MYGNIEIISHTVTLHNDEEQRGERYGANCAEGESEDVFYVAALPDYLAVSQKFKTHFGYNAYAMASPYSSRSEVSDNVWTKCDYIQGYFYSRVFPLENASEFFNKHKA